MKFKFVGIFIFIFCRLNAQFAFIDDHGWESGSSKVIAPDSTLSLKISPETYKDKDTILIQYFYPNKKLAIEGKAIIVDGRSKWKISNWKFYYKNGKLWSTRSYNNKGGVISIDTLVNPKGKPLEKGYARKASLANAFTGYTNFYNDQGQLTDIYRYNGGKIIEKTEVGKYSESQLKRVIIRQFENDKGKWEEYSLEEALELQKTNDKPILLQISNGFNGYTHKGYKNLYPLKEINDKLYENFICAYLDINDTKSVIAGEENQKTVYQGVGNGRYVHDAVSAFVGNAQGTPYFVFIEQGKSVYHYYGIELEPVKFLKILDFYLSGNYKANNWRDFKKSLE